MHPEQIETIVERMLESRLGDLQTLEKLLMVLRRTNTRVSADDESAAIAQNAGLLQSLFISHTSLARVAGNLAEAAQRLQERIATLESALPSLQEAVLNLQLRLVALEGRNDGGKTPGPLEQPPAGNDLR